MSLFGRVKQKDTDMNQDHQYFLPGQVWHLTHRCCRREFLLRFARDRERWMSFLYQAKKRFDLKVLDYMVTSNHIHLLILDEPRNRNTILRSLQLTAGETGREYNLRKNRQEAFWEDRYRATAIQNNQQLIKCMVYIDLNMVRAGVVKHPEAWEHSGFNEIQNPPKRYGLIDLKSLFHLTRIKDSRSLKALHRKCVEDALGKKGLHRESKWTESIAVGDKIFIKIIQKLVAIQAKSRKIKKSGEEHALRKNRVICGDSVRTDAENAFYWNVTP